MAYNDFNFSRMGSMLGQGQMNPSQFSGGANFQQTAGQVDPFQFQNAPLNLGIGSGPNYGAPNTLGQLNGGSVPPGMDIWGKAGIGIQGVSALLNGILGFQQMGMAKDQLNFQKDAFNKNYANQVQTTNTHMEDRQAARVASNANAYMPVEEYMNRNRVA